MILQEGECVRVVACIVYVIKGNWSSCAGQFNGCHIAAGDWDLPPVVLQDGLTDECDRSCFGQCVVMGGWVYHYPVVIGPGEVEMVDVGFLYENEISSSRINLVQHV